MVFQSKLPLGVEVLPARRVAGKYDGQVDWWSVKFEYSALLDRDRLISCAVAEFGKPYSFLNLVVFGWRLAVGKIPCRDRVVLPESYYCSQCVSACYRRAGLDLVPAQTDCCTSPGDVVRGGRIELRAVLRRPR